MPVPSQERRAFLERARKSYQEQMNTAPAVVEYLTKTRGLSEASVAYFRLGAVVDPLPSHEAYRGMIAIPYTAPNGDTLSIRFRRIEGDGAKYLTMPGDKPRPFNTSSIERHTDFICMTEGEFDSMIAHQIGLPAIGIPGVQTWKDDWGLIFAPYRTVYGLCDGDEAGRDFGKRIAEKLPNFRMIDMGRHITPDGEDISVDVNTAYLLHGTEWLLKKVSI